MNYTLSNVNSSLSPEKPGKLIAFLRKHELMDYFVLKRFFKPFTKKDFYLAHHKEYVDSFFSKQLEKRYERILGLRWTKKFAETTRYTNASLYHSIRASIENPSRVFFSPTSGFHHAVPARGALYCSFSGQVISSMKIYRDYGLSGCYIDLDGHYGNSIDSSYDFVEGLDKAIPRNIGNINPDSRHSKYISSLKAKLKELEREIIEERIHYLVFCHGADSHEWDDLGYHLTTDEWVECSEVVYQFVFKIQEKLKRQIPLTLVLFGGYRKDDYDSVLSLHTADLVKCLNVLCGHNIEYVPRVKAKENLE